MRQGILVRAAVITALVSTVTACSTPPEDAGISSPSAPAPASDNSATSTVTGRVDPSAIVELEAVGAEPPLPEGVAIMDQYSKAFVPELLIVRAGQTVEFRNSEDIDHNIQVLRRPTGTTVMNESGSQGQVFRRAFESGSYDVNCDVHPGMRAMIIVSRTPYVAMADNRGEFAFSNVSSGRYTLKVFEDGRLKSQDVTVQGPRTVIPPTPR